MIKYSVMTRTAARSLNEDSGFRSNLDLPQRRKLGMAGGLTRFDGSGGGRRKLVVVAGASDYAARRCGGAAVKCGRLRLFYCTSMVL